MAVEKARRSLRTYKGHVTRLQDVVTAAVDIHKATPTEESRRRMGKVASELEAALDKYQRATEDCNAIDEERFDVHNDKFGQAYELCATILNSVSTAASKAVPQAAAQQGNGAQAGGGQAGGGQAGGGGGGLP